MVQMPFLASGKITDTVKNNTRARVRTCAERLV
jgi:hypothetical protein